MSLNFEIAERKGGVLAERSEGLAEDCYRSLVLSLRRENPSRQARCTFLALTPEAEELTSLPRRFTDPSSPQPPDLGVPRQGDGE